LSDDQIGAGLLFVSSYLPIFGVLFVLMGGCAWAISRFYPYRISRNDGRRQQPRIVVIDAAAGDGRRRLILIRRDNVEHLLMIGGPTDVVIEPNIVRAVAAARETPAPARGPAATDTLPRAVPLGDAGTWPLQPEPAPRLEPAPRSLRAPAPEEPTQWSVEPELPPPPPPRRPTRTADPLAGLAAELARSPEPPRLSMPTDLGGPREPARQREPAREREPVREREVQVEREAIREREREPVREREVVREPVREREREPIREREPVRMREPELAREPGPPPSVPDADFNASADQNLADMAQRLEAALRRPAKPNEARPAEPQPRASNADVNAAPPAHPRAIAPPPAEPSVARAEPKPTKSLYDSLEKEMASLLGRPSGKS
jgi:hypothetical protein